MAKKLKEGHYTREYGIGNYIHARAAMYRKLGNARHARNGEEVNLNIVINAMTSQREKLKQTSLSSGETKKATQQLQKYLNRFFAPTSKSDKEFSKLLNQGLEGFMQDKYRLLLGKLDMGTLDIGELQTKKENLAKEKYEKLLKIEKKNSRQRIEVDNIKHKLSQLSKLMKIMANEGQLNNAIKLGDRITQLEKDLKTIVEKMKKQNEEVSLQSNKGGAGYLYFSGNYYKSLQKDVNSLIDNVNDLIIEYTNSNTNAQKGLLFEALLACANLQLTDLVENDIVKVIQQAVEENQKGNDMGMSVYLETDLYLTPSNWEKNFNDGIIEFGMSKNKTDVSLNMDLGFAEGVKQINISAKNLNMLKNSSSSNISLVSGSPLLYLFMAIQNNDIINHYLNIVLKREVPKKFEIKGARKKEITDTTKIKAREIMKGSLLLLGLRGTGGERGPQADFFVINNNKKAGKNSFFVYSIETLAKKVINNVKNYTVEGNNNTTIENDFGIKNSWINTKNRPSAEGATARIAKILADLHAQKISVTIKKNIIS